MSSLLRTLRDADERLTGLFDHAFAPAHNPWRHLGALAFLSLVIVVLSGIVAFALYDTSVAGAYDSGRRLQLDPLLLGRLLRGVHRYAADAGLLLSVLHLLREATRGHFLGVRWFSWLTGIPLLWLLWLAGITGLWLLWDERALWSISASAEWLQALPLSSDLLARNFLTPQALGDRFFSLIMFIHIGVPLFALAGMWIHVLRVSRARLWPPKVLTLGALAMFAVLALCVPAQSLEMADTGHVTATLSLDWFFQFVHPLVEALSADSVWLLAAALTLLLALAPLLPSRPQAGRSGSPAVVDLANCNGCARCAADCPFGAVIMTARTDQRRHPRQAAVMADLCAACGICVGACPSSTPFRRIEQLVSGIELPDSPVMQMRQQLEARLGALSSTRPRIMLFTCRQALQGGEGFSDAATAVLPLECAAMLPPAFVEYAFRMGADGVLIAGCREGDCEFRLGDRWLQQRFAGQRAPQLRPSVPRDRIVLAWPGHNAKQLQDDLGALRSYLESAAKPTSTAIYPPHEEQHD